MKKLVYILFLIISLLALLDMVSENEELRDDAHRLRKSLESLYSEPEGGAVTVDAATRPAVRR